MWRALLALLLCWAGGCKEPGLNAAVNNTCFADDDCPERGSTCDSNLLRCTRKKVVEPYPLFVRVTPANTGVLSDAGVELVPEYVSDLGTLSGQRDAAVLQVPSAVGLAGSVSSDNDAGALALLPTEVVFSASDAMVPLAASVIETAPGFPKDGGTPHLLAQLDPGRHYDVRVQPLAASSGRLPPFTLQDVGPDRPLDVNYGKLTIASRTGHFVYRDEVRADYVRLQERATGRVISSTARVEKQIATGANGEEREYGAFTLYAEAAAFERANFDLVIGVADFNPWQVTITIDGQRLLSGGDMLLPRVPKPVRVSNWVEDTSAERLPRTDLLFVSNYPVLPDDDAQDASTSTLLGTDWCRWEDPAIIGCKGRFETVSDENGNYTIDLIPGAYDVFVVPRANEPTSQNVIVTKYDDNLKGRPLVVREESASGLVYFVGQRVEPFTGTVYASNLASAHVTLRASRRPTDPFSSWGPVADLNRSLSVVSDRKGHFSIAPDVGYYDFVFEPEHDSYFPWKLWLDCPNGPDTGWPLSAVHLSAPVMVFGSVESDDTGVKLAGAKIEAFTIVYRDEHEPRSVMIGRTFSGANGEYQLVLPTEVGEQARTTCEGRARVVTDSERARR